jgi:hypothetical protein
MLCDQGILKLLVCATMTVSGAASAGHGGALHYESIDIGMYLPGSKVVGTVAKGINPAGDIVGRYTDATGTHGFLLSHGMVTTIDVGGFGAALGCPGATFTTAEGLNAVGEISGFCNDANGNSKGFLRYPFGGFVSIGFPAAIAPANEVSPDNTLPEHITSNGLIVGCFHHLNDTKTTAGDWDAARGGTMYGFVYANGTYSHLPVKGTMHNGITPDGRLIAGVVWPTSDISYAYVVRNGVYELLDLSSLGAVTSFATDVNPASEIVGFFNNSAGAHGFLVDRNGPVALDYPGANGGTRAWGINARGDVVGFYTLNKKNYGFVLRRNRGQAHD